MAAIINSSQEAHQNYCSHCGQKTSVELLSTKRLIKEVSDNIFQINHGLLFLIKKFTIRNTHIIKNYL
jgi:hypothetical protein